MFYDGSHLGVRVVLRVILHALRELYLVYGLFDHKGQRRQLANQIDDAMALHPRVITTAPQKLSDVAQLFRRPISECPLDRRSYWGISQYRMLCLPATLWPVLRLERYRVARNLWWKSSEPLSQKLFLVLHYFKLFGMR